MVVIISLVFPHPTSIIHHDDISGIFEQLADYMFTSVKPHHEMSHLTTVGRVG